MPFQTTDCSRRAAQAVADLQRQTAREGNAATLVELWNAVIPDPRTLRTTTLDRLRSDPPPRGQRQRRSVRLWLATKGRLVELSGVLMQFGYDWRMDDLIDFFVPASGWTEIERKAILKRVEDVREAQHRVG